MKMSGRIMEGVRDTEIALIEALRELGRPRKNIQVVVLMTDDGTARNDDGLKKMWEKRLQECTATHYKIVSAKILKEKQY